MSSSNGERRIEGILARLREPDAVAILVRARLRREGRPWMDQGPAPTVPVAHPGPQSDALRPRTTGSVGRRYEPLKPPG